MSPASPTVAARLQSQSQSPHRRGILRMATLLCLPLWLGGCADAPPATMRRVQGSVLLPDRAPLENGTLVFIRLQDVSRMDAPALLLAERRIEAGDHRQAPFVFDFGIEPERIDPRARYVVSARIEREGRLLYISDTAYPVLTQGAGDKARLVLRRILRP
ncbi:MAG: YbaY family lipoprotein [Burkholderiaceae bacterium]